MAQQEVSTTSPPESWAYVMLKRQTQFHVRKPLVAEDDTRYPDPAFKAMWNPGITGVTQAELQQTIDDGYDVGVFTGQSGLVVIDCDIKHYEAQSEFQVDQNTARLVPIVEAHTEYGILDLQREVENLGHSMDELRTYTVRSKSDGRHLYFKQNPELMITSQVQRQAWHVDVKASVNTWVAAPPSAGYAVLDDRETAVLPLWLAQFLADIKRHLEPIGGRRTRALQRQAREALTTAMSVDLSEREGHLARWTAFELQRVADAQLMNSGWNNACHDVACNLFDGGWDFDSVVDMIRRHARPSNRRNENAMLDTIRSAARKTNTPYHH